MGGHDLISVEVHLMIQFSMNFAVVIACVLRGKFKSQMKILSCINKSQNKRFFFIEFPFSSCKATMLSPDKQHSNESELKGLASWPIVNTLD